ncbi:MAG: hypothetical protein JOZ12_10230 [Sinobacteraceae bacterium]|nr:hypothetical protein [Nevskiaceae bacterium]MBV9911033.1 hypothetical protein [Nevskiaceae bacterium]
MKALLGMALTAALAAGSAYADCSYPAPPAKLPDGNTATMEEMVAGQKAVKEYDKAINAYISCIQLERSDKVKEVSKSGSKPSPEQQKALDDMERMEVQKHNAAVDQLQSVADRFNEQVKVYKAKNGDKK